MYYLNPVVLFAGVMLVLMLLTLLWRRLSKTEPMQKAAGALMRVSATWFVVMLVLGLIMGLNHSLAHPNCQRYVAAHPGYEACAHMLDTYGK